MGIFLFGSEPSFVVVKNEAKETGEETKEKKLSKEISEDIVKKLEEGSSVPGEEENEEEEEGGGESGTRNGELERGDGKSETETEASEKKNEKTEEGDEGSENVELSNRNVPVDQLVSFGFTETKSRGIDTVVIHSTYNALDEDSFSVSKILGIYRNYGVSPHYLIARDGTVYRLVEEKNIAFHAGESKMKDGRTDVNTFSIGIEIIGKDDGHPREAQYESLKRLLADIEARYAIEYIVGHSDIASGRKTDPWGFEWEKIGGKKL